MMRRDTQQEKEQEQGRHSVTQHDKEQSQNFHEFISARGDAKARWSQQLKCTRPTARETRLKRQSQSRLRRSELPHPARQWHVEPLSKRPIREKSRLPAGQVR